MGLLMYASDNSDALPTAKFTGQGSSQPWQSYLLIDQPPGPGAPGTPANFSNPINHGFLYSTKIITAGKTYYCPSASPSVNFALYDTYESASVPWPMAPSNPNTSDYLRSSYNYYPQSAILVTINGTIVNSNLFQLAKKSIQLSTDHAIMTDLIQTRDTLSHLTGNNAPGVNALWGDSHVTFSMTSAAFNPSLWSGSGPGNNTIQFIGVLGQLKP